MPYNRNQQTLFGATRADHSNLGKEFERDLDATHAKYAIQRLAKIDHHPNEWVYIGNNEYTSLLANPKMRSLVAKTGDGYWMKRRATNVDFSGVAKIKLLNVGVEVKFDAKMTAGERIPLDNFETHQVDNLILSTECGAIAGFLVMFYDARPVERVFFVPPDLVRRKKDKNFGKIRASKGDGSITIAEMEQYAREIPYSNRFVDWYPVLIPR